MEQKITTLFCDVGGVLLTNGWDHQNRAKAVQQFGLDAAEYESRHQLMFGDYEEGRITLEEYLRYTIFFLPRSFSYEDFIEFMYAQSKPFQDMIDLVKHYKKKYRLKMVIVSNEGRELTEYRFDKFELTTLADFFIVSCFTGFRKPDRRMFQLALDTAQVLPENAVYIDDREVFIEIAREMGIQAIRHADTASTEEALSSLFDNV